MTWKMNSDDSITFKNTVMLDGELTSNIAQIKRVYQKKRPLTGPFI